MSFSFFGLVYEVMKRTTNMSVRPSVCDLVSALNLLPDFHDIRLDLLQKVLKVSTIDSVTFILHVRA